MKKVCSLFLVAVLLSSCGIFRDVKKDKFEHKISIKEKIDSNVTIEERSLDRGKTVDIDKGKIVTERETVTKTKKPGANVEVNADMMKLTNGETISKDSAGIKVSVMLDSLSNRLKINVTGPEEESETTTRERITEDKDRTKEDQRNQENSTNTQVVVSASSQKDDDLKAGNTDKKGKNPISIWIGGALFLVIIGYAFWKIVLKR